MANTTNTKKYLEWTQLQKYDQNIKTKMATDDAATLASAKEYADSLADNYDAAGTAQAKVDALANGAVKANTDAIATLNGDATTEGSVAKQIKTATDTLKAEISASAYDDTAIKNRIAANETALGILNGTGEGSVNKKVGDAVAAIIADAPEAYDTLKEIADWISDHASDAVQMNSQISTNKADIAALKTLVNQLPEGSESTTIVEYITEKVDGLKDELTAAIATAKTEAITEAGTNTDAKITAKVGDIGESTVKSYVDAAKTDAVTTASADASAKADKALADAKTYTDELAERVTTLESDEIDEITDEDIDSLFAAL